VDALLVSDEPEHITYRVALVELAAKSRIPAIYPYREPVEVGGLMAYSIDLADILSEGTLPQVRLRIYAASLPLRFSGAFFFAVVGCSGLARTGIAPI
jgi:hypothetical protein